MKTTAQVMVETLKEIGVKFIYGVPSGNWVDYMAAVEQVDGMEFVLVSNEASGGFMADAYWRVTGRIAACFGTFGPGACNLSTGVCGGYLDRSPMLVFSDEMNDAMRHRVSQMNIDHQTLFSPITKWTTRLEPGKVKEIIYKAYATAINEVPGPVHIGLPAGIGSEDSPVEPLELEHPEKTPDPSPDALLRMAKLFHGAKKPILALGITSLRSEIRELILNIVEKYKIPVVLTPMAKGMLPEENPCYAGVLAHALSDRVAKIHQKADLVVGVGYDPVELNYEDWMPDVPLIHIDTSPADLDTENFTLACDVVGGLMPALEQLLAVDCPPKAWDLDDIGRQKRKMFERLADDGGNFGPIAVLNGLRKMLPGDGIMTCDVGAHLHLIGQHWQTPLPDCQLMTNGCSSMGFAIPAAIGAKLGCPSRPVCCVVGDGGFAMMAGELATAMRLDLDIVFVVISDAHLSLIRIKQEKKGNSGYGTSLQPEPSTYKPSNRVFGVPVYPARDGDEYDRALKAAFAVKGPAIVEVFIDIEEYEELVLKGNK